MELQRLTFEYDVGIVRYRTEYRMVPYGYCNLEARPGNISARTRNRIKLCPHAPHALLAFIPETFVVRASSGICPIEVRLVFSQENDNDTADPLRTPE